MHQRRTLAGAAVLDCLDHGAVAGDSVRSVDLGEVEVGKVCDEPGDVAARGVGLDGSGDGIAIVFDDVEDGELCVRGGVERFPEFALAGRTLADRDVGDLIAVKTDVFVGTIIRVVLNRRFGIPGEVASCLGTANGVQALGRGGGAGRDDV